jgi:hypothetical protein
MVKLDEEGVDSAGTACSVRREIANPLPLSFFIYGDLREVVFHCSLLYRIY